MMKALLKELWGLFVDDDALAISLTAWCALVLVLCAILPDNDGAALFVGSLVVLLGNVAAAAIRAHHGGATAHAEHASAKFWFRGGDHSLP